MNIKWIIPLIIFSLNVAHADQESSKDRVDDCFLQLQGMLNQMNSVQGTIIGPAFNQNFLNTKARCYELKNTYEQKYGKYNLPSTKAPSLKESDRKNLPLLKIQICETFQEINQDKLGPDDSYKEASIQNKNEILNGLIKRYTNAAKKMIDPNKSCKSKAANGLIAETTEEKMALTQINMGRLNTLKYTPIEIQNGLCSSQQQINRAENKDAPYVKEEEKRLAGYFSLYQKLTQLKFDISKCK